MVEINEGEKPPEFYVSQDKGIVFSKNIGKDDFLEVVLDTEDEWVLSDFVQFCKDHPFLT